MFHHKKVIVYFGQLRKRYGKSSDPQHTKVVLKLFQAIKKITKEIDNPKQLKTFLDFAEEIYKTSVQIAKKRDELEKKLKKIMRLESNTLLEDKVKEIHEEILKAHDLESEYLRILESFDSESVLPS